MEDLSRTKDTLAWIALVASGIATLLSLSALSQSGSSAGSRIDQIIASQESRLAQQHTDLEAFKKNLGGDIDQRIASLRSQIFEQRADYDGFRKAFSDMWQSRTLSGKKELVVLDMESKTYSRLDTANGFFLISCQGVRPFLDGQKATLLIGNPLIARYVEYKIKVHWGPRFLGPENDTVKWLAWYRSLKTKDYEYPGVLEPSKWNEIEVVLPQTKADELGYVDISLVTNTVSLGSASFPRPDATPDPQ